MLGFGIGEIILIIIVAVIVLGPDKLPNAIIEITKIWKVLKNTIQDAKETIDREVNLAELKREAQEYKEKLENSVDISKEIKDANLVSEIQQDMNDIKHLFQDYQPRDVVFDSNGNTKLEDKVSTDTQENITEVKKEGNNIQK